MPRLIKRRKAGSKALPVVGPRNEPKFGQNVLDHDLDGGEVRNPLNRVKIHTGQHTHRDLAEAQMEGSFAFKDNRYTHNVSDSSKEAWAAPEPVNCAPPQAIRVARFPKKESEPCLVLKQTTDVKAEKHHGDAKLGHIPDFREDWGDGERWYLYRRAYYVHVGPEDIPDVKLHGWYVVFATWDPGYEKSTHKFIEGYGRHVHEDFFVAKINTYPDSHRWTAYVDMPEEFLSTTTKDGWKLYQSLLVETNTSMIGPLYGW
ncbi:MAG: hypothetical protein ASARMPRED_003960 [Alectoria sarmentosa]|nr:MAG: hypothetical protein ASARMPRED_003960 [Alectoria sarmentosa]